MTARAAFAPALALALILGSASGSRLQASGLPAEVLPAERQASAPERPTSAAERPTSAAERQALVAERQTSAAERQTSVAELVSEIRVHGNVTVPDAEVLRLAGVSVGAPLPPGGVEAIAERLKSSGRFDSVDVRRRFRSLDMTEVALVLLVHEPPGPVGGNPVARTFGRALTQTMFMPILSFEEGYGFTYGARFSTIDWLHGGERLSVPLTWGGTRQAAVEADRTFRTGPLARLYGRFGIDQRENPHYEIDDQRVGFQVRTEHAFARAVRAGVDASRERVEFGATDRNQWTVGVDAALDTRGDPAFPSNAVLLEAGWSSLHLDGDTAPINRYRAGAHGFLRLMGQSVLAARAQYDGADRTLPPYEQLLLGGGSTLRGHAPGEFASDKRLTGSVEVRVPLDSPMGSGRAGVRIFYDAGQAWNVGERRSDVMVQQGAGAGVFLLARLVNISLDAAANLSGGGGRLHFGFGLRF